MAREHGERRIFRMTRVEIALVVLFILGMAAIMVPTAHSELEEARLQITSSDLGSLASAMDRLLDDAGPLVVPPLLVGPGRTPPELPPLRSSARIEAVLLTPPPLLRVEDRSSHWRGPYLKKIPADPWGNAYLIFNVTGGHQFQCWVLSPGPDGRIDTDVRAAVTAGDDLGIRVR